MKRRTETLRQSSEIKADNQTQYYDMVKMPSKVNPIFCGWMRGVKG